MKVAEEAEKLAIGSLPSYTFGGGTIYGLTNMVGRLTKTITAPTDSGWTPEVFVDEVLDMIQLSVNAYHYGPWMLYVGTGWSKYMGQDFKAASDITLRERILKLEGIQDVQTLDHLTGFQVCLVQMTSDVIREVVGMDITTVQWPSKGGMQLNYKVMAILVPQLRKDFNGKTGIVHGNVAG